MSTPSACNLAAYPSFAIVRALAERDEGFADVYLAHKEATEAGEMAQKVASNLAGTNKVLARMRADPG